MEKQKKEQIEVYDILLIGFLCYLIFAFVNCTMDFTLWDREDRILYIIATLGAMFGYMTYKKTVNID